jgi:autotransporter-associated beta strand protein
MIARSCLATVSLIAMTSVGKAQTVTVPTGTTQTNSSVIADGSSANTLTVTGGGTLALTSGANTYSGGTVVTGNSTLQVGADADLGASTSTLTLGSGAGSGILDLTPSSLGSASSRPITLGGTGGTIIASPNIWTFSGVVSGSGGLTVQSPSGTPGTIILGGANTYTGGTTIAGGSTLEITTDNNLGATSGALTLGDASTGGTLSLINTAPVTSARSVILDPGGGTIDSGSFSWTLTNPVTGTGGLSVGGSSTLILAGANTYTGDTSVTAGTLELGDAATPSASIAGDVSVTGGTLDGTGSIFGNLTNSGGDVMPGVGGVGSMRVGSFTQTSGGTLTIAMTPSGAAALSVANTAALGGTLALTPLGLLHAGTYNLLTASSITGSFSQLPAQMSVGLAQSVVQTGSSIELELTQNTSIPENPSIFPALANTALDEAQSGTQTVMDRLAGTRAQATLDQMVIANGADHVDDDWGCAGCSPYGAWFKATGDFATTDGSAAASAYNDHSVGFTTGIDGGVSDTRPIILGVAIGYSRSSVQEVGDANGTISTPRAMIYGDWWRGRFAVDGSLGVGYSSISSNRPLGGAGTAMASYGGPQMTAGLQASALYDVRSIVLTPAVGVKYARQRLRGFTESGAGAYDLDGMSESGNSMRPYVSATATTRFDIGAQTRIEPQVRLAYEVEALNSPGISVDPTADDYTFRYPGVTPSRGRFSVSAGATIEKTRALDFFTDAGLLQAGNTRGAQFDAGVRYLF